MQQHLTKRECHECVVDKLIIFSGMCANKAKHKHIPEDAQWVFFQGVITLNNINSKDPMTSTLCCFVFECVFVRPPSIMDLECVC